MPEFPPTQSPGRGRPTSLTYALVDALCEAIEDGLTYELACDNVGIDRSTFYKWQAGKFPKRTSVKLQSYFFNNIKKADTTLVRELLRDIRAHGKQDREGQWQALAWIVERRYRQEYGRQQVLEHTGPAGAPLTVVIERDDA